jgi:alanine racemase
MTAEPGAILTVDPAAVVANWRLLAAHAAPGTAAAVVKADAYGLGAAVLAPALAAAGCRHFFVATPDEALALRPLLPGAFLAVLGGLWPGAEADFIAADIVPVLNDLAEIGRWRDAGRAAGRALPALLHVDTGMSRLGLDAVGLATLAADRGRLDGIDLRYVMTHLLAAEAGDDPANAAQAARFSAACAVLPPARRSFANSSGLFLGPGFASDLARPGAALWGINPTPGQANPMHPVVRLRARVLGLREIPPGATVGYNATFTAARVSRIATVAVGYADGWRRALSNAGAAGFDGARVPLVGRVSMDLTTFDVTAEPGIQPGDWLDLIGPGQDVDAVAAAAGTNGYEILTGLGPRIARRYGRL